MDNELVEVVENQRFWGVMWGPPMIPNLDWPAWSDAYGKPVQMTRPPAMDGQGGWFVVRLDSTDEDGWLYGTMFDRLTQARPGGRASKRVNDAVRSRVWRRFNADTELQPMHAKHLAAAVSAHKGAPSLVDALATQGYQISGGQILSALTSNAIFKQEAKPSVFRMWQLLMQLWNDSAKRHGMLKMMPLDPVGLYLAVKAHTAGAADMRKSGLRVGRLLVAGACQSAQAPQLLTPRLGSDPSGPAALPDVLSAPTDEMADLVSRGPLAGLHVPTNSNHPVTPNPLRPTSAHGTHHQLAMGPPRAFSPITRDARAAGEAVLHASSHRRYNRRSHPNISTPTTTPYPDSVVRQQSGGTTPAVQGESKVSSPTESASSEGFHVVSLKASDVMDAHPAPQQPCSSPADASQKASTSTGQSAWLWPWRNASQTSKKRPSAENVPSTADTAVPASARAAAQETAVTPDQDPASKRQLGSPGVTGHFAMTSSPHRSTSGAGLPRVRSGMLPDMDEPAALVQELMTITNYARAAYGYVMAAGHMATLSSMIQMVGASAFFNPVSGASAEANNQAIQSLTGIPQTDILMAEWRSNVFRPCHFLALDRLHGRLVLCIRGSMELGDICTDLAAQPSHFEFGGGLGSCHVHEGLISAALYVEQSTQAALLEAAEKYPDWPLLVTGHSLGAGVASLLAMLWRYGQGKEGRPSPWADRMYCVAVACPPVVSESVAAKSDDFVISLVHHMDFVPRLSHYSVELALVDMVRNSPAAQLADNLSATLAAMTSTLPWVNNNNNNNNNGSSSSSGNQKVSPSPSVISSGKPDQSAPQDESGASLDSVTQQPAVGVQAGGEGGVEAGGEGGVDAGGGGVNKAGGDASVGGAEPRSAPSFEVELITQRNPYTAVQQLSQPRRELSLPGGASRPGSGGGVGAAAGGRQLEGMEGLLMRSLAAGDVDSGCQESILTALFGGLQEESGGSGAAGSQQGLQQALKAKQAGADGPLSAKLMEYWSDILEVVKPRDSQAVDTPPVQPIASEDSGTLQAVAAASRSMAPEAIVARSASAHHPLSPAWQASFSSADLENRPASVSVSQPGFQDSRRTSRLRFRTVDDVAAAQEPPVQGVQGPPSLSDVMNQVVDDFEAAVQEKQSREGSTPTTPVSVASLNKEDVSERLAPTKLYLPGRVLWIMFEEETVVQYTLKEATGKLAADQGAAGNSNDAKAPAGGEAGRAAGQQWSGQQDVERRGTEPSHQLLDMTIAQDFMSFTVDQPALGRPSSSTQAGDDPAVEAPLQSPPAASGQLPIKAPQPGALEPATTRKQSETGAGDGSRAPTGASPPARLLSFNVQSADGAGDDGSDELGSSSTPSGRSLSKAGLSQRLSLGLRQLKSNVEQVLSKATLEFGQASPSGGDTARSGPAGAVQDGSAGGAVTRQVVCLLEADRHAFEELSLVASCAGDHIPDSYYSALNQLYAAVLTGRTVASVATGEAGARRQSGQGGMWAGGHAVPNSALPETVRADTAQNQARKQAGDGKGGQRVSGGGDLTRQGSGTTKSFLDMWRIA